MLAPAPGFVCSLHCSDCHAPSGPPGSCRDPTDIGIAPLPQRYGSRRLAPDPRGGDGAFSPASLRAKKQPRRLHTALEVLGRCRNSSIDQSLPHRPPTLGAPMRPASPALIMQAHACQGCGALVLLQRGVHDPGGRATLQAASPAGPRLLARHPTQASLCARPACMSPACSTVAPGPMLLP